MKSRQNYFAIGAILLLLSLQAFAQVTSNTISATPPLNSEPRLVTQLGHSAAITSVAFSPDGKFVVTGSSDTTARLWETASGKEVYRLEGHSGSVDAVAFSRDGRFVVTGGADGLVRVWDALTGKEVQNAEGHYTKRFEGPARILAVAISPDGKFLVAGGASTAAIIWSLETNQELHRLKGHQGSINAITFSQDGRFILTGSSDRTARLWDAGTATELHRYPGHTNVINTVAISNDNHKVLTGSSDGTVRLWDAEAAAVLKTHSMTGGTEVKTVAFSPDDRSVAMGGRRGAMYLLEALTGKELQHFAGHKEDINAITFAPDGHSLLTGSSDKTVRLWNLADGHLSQSFEGRSDNISSITFSPNGRFVLMGGYDNAARLWDGTNGQEVRRFEGHTDKINAVAFSADNNLVATASSDRSARVWDATTGKQKQIFNEHSADVMAVTFSPDGRYLLTGTKDGMTHLWNITTAKKVRRFDGNYDWVNTAAFSPDSAYLLTVGIDRTARLWETATGTQKQSFKGHTEDLWSVAFSPDGKMVATGSVDKTARLWDVASGTEIKVLEAQTGTIISVAFSPDGKQLLTGSAGSPARLWDVKTGTLVRALEGKSRDVDFIRFSPDGRFVVTGGPDKFVRLWDVATGKEIQSFQEHPEAALSVAFSPDSRFLLTGSRDGTTRVADTANGNLRCRLISFRARPGTSRNEVSGGWAVVDQEGRFDASNAGDVEGMHWLVGREPIALSQLKERYYEPGLLAKIMGFSKLPFRDVSAFKDVKLFPRVEWSPPAAGSTQLVITLTNRGGGIGPVQVYVNNKPVTPDARPSGFNPQSKQATLTVDLANSSLMLGEKNTIEVVASNAEGSLNSERTSRGTSQPWIPQGEADDTPTELYAIIAGISDYASPNLTLNFAAKDAVDMANAIEIGAKRLFGTDKVHLTLLTTAQDPRAVLPTKANFRKAFDEARKAKPTDVLFVYLAGHGITLQRNSDTYCYLTRDANTTDGSRLATNPELLDQMAITNIELMEWTNTQYIKANKQVLVLDTCAAGAVVKKLVAPREVDGDRVRALERLKERSGFIILMGSAEDAPSYEASQYGQGLLTYALLRGIQGLALKETGEVDVIKLFNYAADEVPQLARDIGGIQKPEIKIPVGGASFPVGLIKSEDKSKIHVATLMPIILRPLLINADEGTDNLNLNQGLRKRLRDENYASSRGEQATQVFFDEEEFPNAIRPSGTYVIENQLVKIRLILSRNSEKLATLQVNGVKDDQTKTINNIMEAIANTIKTLPPVSEPSK
jgi:WD40 repeat protein